jgi:hypothetical protein
MISIDVRCDNTNQSRIRTSEMMHCSLVFTSSLVPFLICFNNTITVFRKIIISVIPYKLYFRIGIKNQLSVLFALILYRCFAMTVTVEVLIYLEQKSIWSQCYTKYSQLWIWRHTTHATHQEDPGFVCQNCRYSPIFWDITLCSPLKVNWCFRRTYHPHLQKPAWRELWLLPASRWFLLCYSWTLKMEAMCYSEMSVDFQWNMWRCIPEDRTLHNHCSENFKSYKIEDILLFCLQPHYWHRNVWNWHP